MGTQVTRRLSSKLLPSHYYGRVINPVVSHCSLLPFESLSSRWGLACTHQKASIFDFFKKKDAQKTEAQVKKTETKVAEVIQESELKEEKPIQTEQTQSTSVEGSVVPRKKKNFKEEVTVVNGITFVRVPSRREKLVNMMNRAPVPPPSLDENVVKNLPVYEDHVYEKPGEERFRKTPLTLPVTNLTGELVGTIKVAAEIFDLPLRKDILHRVVLWQLAKRRKGLARAKNRAEVAGSGRKTRPQKKTGFARAGERRSPIFRGGGVVHGPRGPRSFGYTLPKKIRALGLKTLLSTKLREGLLFIIDKAELPTHKTKGFQQVMDARAWTSVLIIDGEEVNTNFQRATSNVKQVDVLPHLGLNVYDGLKRSQLVLTKEAVEQIHYRLLPRLGPWQEKIIRDEKKKQLLQASASADSNTQKEQKI